MSIPATKEISDEALANLESLQTSAEMITLSMPSGEADFVYPPTEFTSKDLEILEIIYNVMQAQESSLDDAMSNVTSVWSMNRIAYIASVKYSAAKIRKDRENGNSTSALNFYQHEFQILIQKIMLSPVLLSRLDDEIANAISQRNLFQSELIVQVASLGADGFVNKLAKLEDGINLLKIKRNLLGESMPTLRYNSNCPPDAIGVTADFLDNNLVGGTQGDITDPRRVILYYTRMGNIQNYPSALEMLKYIDSKTDSYTKEFLFQNLEE